MCVESNASGLGLAEEGVFLRSEGAAYVGTRSGEVEVIAQLVKTIKSTKTYSTES